MKMFSRFKEDKGQGLVEYGLILLKRFINNNRAQGLVEYGLILGLVSVVAVGALGGVGDKVSGTFGLASDPEVIAMIDQGYVPISSAEDLEGISSREPRLFGEGTLWEGEFVPGLDKKYIQVKDIDLGDLEGGFEPIGSVSNRFSGTYNGGGYRVENLTVNQESDYAGFFGRADGATFKNVQLVNVDVRGRNNVGGLVGNQLRSTITSSYVIGDVSGNVGVGGLVGRHSNHSYVKNSYTDTDVVGVKYVGGVVGHQVGILSTPLNSSETHNSYAMGTVKGEIYVGGLIGWNYYGVAPNTAVINSGWVTDNNLDIRGIGAGYSVYRGDLYGLSRTEVKDIIQGLIN